QIARDGARVVVDSRMIMERTAAGSQLVFEVTIAWLTTAVTSTRSLRSSNRDPGQGRRHRDLGGGASTPVRPLHAGGLVGQPAGRRARNRAHPGAPPGRAAWRPCGGQQ